MYSAADIIATTVENRAKKVAHRLRLIPGVGYARVECVEYDRNAVTVRARVSLRGVPLAYTMRIDARLPLGVTARKHTDRLLDILEARLSYAENKLEDAFWNAHLLDDETLSQIMHRVVH